MAAKKQIFTTPYFSFCKPYIMKDKANKKWLVYYWIKYQDEEKEYRRDTGGKEMRFNAINNFTEREIVMNTYIANLVDDLKQGIDLNRIEDARKRTQELVEDKQKYRVVYVYQKWLEHSGYINPDAKKINTAANFRNLFDKKFLPYLEAKHITDVREVRKGTIKEFLNYWQYDQKVWTKSTTRVKNQWLGSFFKYCVDNDLLEHNPTHNIRIVGEVAAKKARFQVFTKEEIDLILKTLEENPSIVNSKLELLIKGIYYSYIRISEWLRLEIGNVDLLGRRISIRPEQSKTGQKGVTKDVFIHPELIKCLKKYFALYPDLEIDNKLIFHYLNKNRSITSMTLRAYWRDFITPLKEEYPNLFKREGLSLYSFKHSGVTHFYNDNLGKLGSNKLIDFIKKQCRHTSLVTTERYLSDDLGIDTDGDANFFDELGIK